MADKRRSPDVRQRRRDLCDAAIQLLADHGAKGLSHPRVDRQAGVPEGSTSYYFRTRAALVHAVAERVAELDLADLQSVTEALPNDAAAASRLAAVAWTSFTESGLTRSRARFELLLQASRDPVLAGVFQRNVSLYADLHRDLVERTPAGAELTSSEVADQALVTMNFISGLMMAAAAGAPPVSDRDHLERLLWKIVNGMTAATVNHEGR